jgi:hypothetical protein
MCVKQPDPDQVRGLAHGPKTDKLSAVTSMVSDTESSRGSHADGLNAGRLTRRDLWRENP